MRENLIVTFSCNTLKYFCNGLIPFLVYQNHWYLFCLNPKSETLSSNQVGIYFDVKNYYGSAADYYILWGMHLLSCKLREESVRMKVSANNVKIFDCKHGSTFAVVVHCIHRFFDIFSGRTSFVSMNRIRYNISATLLIRWFFIHKWKSKAYSPSHMFRKYDKCRQVNLGKWMGGCPCQS
jgi:hypothetical protein